MSILLALLLQSAVPSPAQTAPPADPSNKRHVRFNMAVDRAFFTSNDANGDGGLGLEEFRSALMKRMEAEVTAQLADLPEARKKFDGVREKLASVLAAQFRMWDVNSDGTLLFEEMESVNKAQRAAKG